MVGTWPKCLQEQKRLEIRRYKYEGIKECHETEGWSIQWMCSFLKISRASYYKWLNRKPTKRDKENEELVEKMTKIYEGNNGLFGYRKMTMALNRVEEKKVNPKRVRRLMRANKLECAFRKKSRYKYVKVKPEETAENILNREFKADRPNQKWSTDVTEIKIPNSTGKFYISTIIDLYDRYPVAWHISTRNDSELVNRTLEKALEANPEGCDIFHMDRGTLYTRRYYAKWLENYGIRQSMSRVSKCIDNGPMEGFQGLLKDMCHVLYPNVKNGKELRKALEATFRYYIDEYPQERFKGRTAGEVRADALENGIVGDYPIRKNPQVVRFWKKIEMRKNKMEGEKTGLSSITAE